METGFLQLLFQLLTEPVTLSHKDSQIGCQFNFNFSFVNCLFQTHRVMQTKGKTLLDGNQLIRTLKLMLILDLSFISIGSSS